LIQFFGHRSLFFEEGDTFWYHLIDHNVFLFLVLLFDYTE
jgi:hypothetical protein